MTERWYRVEWETMRSIQYDSASPDRDETKDERCIRQTAGGPRVYLVPYIHPTSILIILPVLTLLFIPIRI